MTPGQCRAARLLLGWTIGALANRARVLFWQAEYFEAGKSVRPSIERQLRQCLQAAGIRFESDWGVTYRPKRTRGRAKPPWPFG